MAAVLFVELPSANTEAAAGDRGGFFLLRRNDWRARTCLHTLPSRRRVRSGKNPHPACLPLARALLLG